MGLGLRKECLASEIFLLVMYFLGCERTFLLKELTIKKLPFSSLVLEGGEDWRRVSFIIG